MTDEYQKIPFNAARYPDEDYETYQLRRWNETRYMEFLTRGRVIWDSSKKGTYYTGVQLDTFELNLT